MSLSDRGLYGPSVRSNFVNEFWVTINRKWYDENFFSFRLKYLRSYTLKTTLKDEEIEQYIFEC